MSAPLPLSPEDFAGLSGVSRETLERLKAYVSLLTEWNARQNLVSDNSLQDVWRRHIWDSAQLAPLIPPNAKSLIDLGSGAGFPALVLAAMFREKPDFRVVVTDSIAKKCRFLEAAAMRMALKVDVHNGRIEGYPRARFDVVTARACAPLEKLFGYAQHFRSRGTICLFLKGQSVDAELTEARKSWNIRAIRHQSRSDPSGVILEVREFAHVRS
ncbi:MAG: 16S rRNA (guanine(527)-N(7))-methyltransferase RsmG [Rhizomicrobium sp.]